MTNKQIIELANNQEIMSLLERIKIETDNLTSKTIYEQKNVNAKIKDYANEIKSLLQ